MAEELAVKALRTPAVWELRVLVPRAEELFLYRAELLLYWRRTSRARRLGW